MFTRDNLPLLIELILSDFNIKKESLSDFIISAINDGDCMGVWCDLKKIAIMKPDYFEKINGYSACDFFCSGINQLVFISNLNKQVGK